jgi:large subunit ribosomal protein L24
MQRIKKGDTVEVIAGKDLGQQGQVLRVLPKEDRLIVERVNIVKKHQRPQQAGRQQIQGGIVEKEAALHLSNVQLICPQCKARTRINFRINEEGHKVRVCKHCKQDIE